LERQPATQVPETHWTPFWQLSLARQVWRHFPSVEHCSPQAQSVEL
jgi:hypothetical protein